MAEEENAELETFPPHSDILLCHYGEIRVDGFAYCAPEFISDSASDTAESEDIVDEEDDELPTGIARVLSLQKNILKDDSENSTSTFTVRFLMLRNGKEFNRVLSGLTVKETINDGILPGTKRGVFDHWIEGDIYESVLAWNTLLFPNSFGGEGEEEEEEEEEEEQEDEDQPGEVYWIETKNSESGTVSIERDPDMLARGQSLLEAVKTYVATVEDLVATGATLIRLENADKMECEEMLTLNDWCLPTNNDPNAIQWTTWLMVGSWESLAVLCRAGLLKLNREDADFSCDPPAACGLNYPFRCTLKTLFHPQNQLFFLFDLMTYLVSACFTGTKVWKIAIRVWT